MDTNKKTITTKEELFNYMIDLCETTFDAKIIPSEQKIILEFSKDIFEITIKGE